MALVGFMQEQKGVCPFQQVYTRYHFVVATNGLLLLLQCDYPQSNGRHVIENGERYKVNSMVFRPESAPTVLDMSPDGSLSGPPSVRTSDLSDMHRGN